MTPAGGLGHFGEGVAEDIVQEERDALGRGHRFEHDEIPRRTVRLARRLTFRGVASSSC
jgi:hypothetical protein